METVMVMGLGDKLGIFSFWCGILAVIFTFLSLVTGFVGTQLTGKGIMDTIKATHETAHQASVRNEPNWGAFQKVTTDKLPPQMPLKVSLGYKLTATDTRTPLQIKFSAFENGLIHEMHSGESGMVSLHLNEPRTFYFSVAHPEVACEINVHGWEI